MFTQRQEEELEDSVPLLTHLPALVSPPRHSPPYSLNKPAACLTFGNLDVQGRSDQSHEGGVEVNCVVICYRQVHPQKSL